MVPVNRTMVEAIRKSIDKDRYLDIRASSLTQQADCVFTVSGNGMSPFIKDGDHVLVAYTDALVPGDIGVFLTERGVAIRQYYEEGLRSFRPDLEQYHIGGDMKYSIIGRYLGVVQPEDIRH